METILIQQSFFALFSLFLAYYVLVSIHDVLLKLATQLFDVHSCNRFVHEQSNKLTKRLLWLLS